MKPDFDKAEKAARLLRLAQPSSNLNLDVTKMKFDLPIIIDTFQNYSALTHIPVSSLIPSPLLKDGYLIKAYPYFIVLSFLVCILFSHIPVEKMADRQSDPPPLLFTSFRPLHRNYPE